MTPCSPTSLNNPIAQTAAGALQQVGAMFHQRGWSLGTSSNYSIVVGREPTRLLLTASGKDKGRLAATDFVLLDGAGKPVEQGAPSPSAETALHVLLAALPGVGSVLHTHSVWATVLSELYEDGFWIEGYEMLKGLDGIRTHEHQAWVPIFDNSQDIPALAQLVRARMAASPARWHGFLIRRHGLYTWGRDVDEARRHVEIYEFLFEVLGRKLSLQPR